MRQVLLMLLVIVAVIMIYLGMSMDAKPPLFTGIGFVIIIILFFNKSKKD